MEITVRPLVHPPAADGKTVTAWYRPGVGYVNGEQHTSLAHEMAAAGLYVPPVEDGDEIYFSSMQDRGWLRLGVISRGPARTAYVVGAGIDHRSMEVRKVVGDLFDAEAVGFHTPLEVGDDRRDVLYRGEVLDSL